MSSEEQGVALSSAGHHFLHLHENVRPSEDFSLTTLDTNGHVMMMMRWARGGIARTKPNASYYPFMSTESQSPQVR